jgi:hypothetical protein
VNKRQIPLERLEFEISLSDQFWFEKTKRYIKSCDSVEALQEMAIMLAKIATQRHSIIKGLVNDLAHFNNKMEKSES